MRKSVFVLALLAAGIAGSAMAKDISKKAMNDAEMDKVTAGYDVHTYNQGWNYNANVNYHARNNGFQGNNPHAAYTN
jgi:hypothetical protein